MLTLGVHSNYELEYDFTQKIIEIMRDQGVDFYLYEDMKESIGLLVDGYFHTYGKPGYEKDIEKGMKLMQQAADNGNRFADFLIGKAYMDVRVPELELNLTKSMSHLKKAAKKDCPESCFWLGNFYMQSKLKNLLKAENYLKRAGELGVIPAYAYLGEHFHRLGDKQSIEKAIRCCEIVLDEKHGENMEELFQKKAYKTLASIYSESIGFIDYKKAVENLEICRLRFNDISAYKILGLIYVNGGHGVQKK